jgi:hypothetical protein
MVTLARLTVIIYRLWQAILLVPTPASSTIPRGIASQKDTVEEPTRKRDAGTGLELITEGGWVKCKHNAAGVGQDYSFVPQRGT